MSWSAIKDKSFTPPTIQEYQEKHPSPHRIEFGAKAKKGEGARQEPLISLITIVRNGEKTLEKTIQSVLGQSYPHIEYIIIDGASTDNTLQVIEKYKGQITYCLSEADSGISDAFNKGIACASGDLIGLINADDWYERDVLKKVARQYSSEGPAIIYGKLKFWKGDKLQHVAAADHSRLLQNMSVNHPSVFVPRKYYEDFGLYCLNLKIAMDYEWLRRASLRGAKFCYMDEVFSNMQLMGVSDKAWRKGCAECFEIRREQGMSAASNYAIYLKVLSKTYVRKFLERIRFHFLIKLYRK